MKRCISILCTLLASLFLVSCSTEKEFTADPYANYDALWQILDRNYCYFDLKLPEGTTWRDLYHKHRKDLRPKMTTDSLFLIMTELLAELKDGHVNLSSTFNLSRYWKWRTEGPRTFDAELVERYLGEDYKIAGALAYKALDYPDEGKREIPLGYIRVASFNSGLSDGNVSAALNRLRDCDGLILDLRANGGGQVSSSELLARHFIDKRRHVGYMSHKTGPGHNDFSRQIPIYLDPLTRGTIWLKPVFVLVNQGVYSAANDFVLRLKGLPHVRIIGVKTGGGAGLPMSSELPNGWGIRFSHLRYSGEGRRVWYRARYQGRGRTEAHRREGPLHRCLGTPPDGLDQGDQEAPQEVALFRLRQKEHPPQRYTPYRCGGCSLS